ncbi:unnamed protein product [Rotaria socialis]|uniref:Uncharacterized protein n=3 Tax=Rotaria socialis TaxID=392032 RepID=A0A820W3T0_9BILA|nr:unnamed protein product [Rotaria socialis]
MQRTTSSILYVSRMNAHNLPAGTHVKVPEAPNGYHIVSGSGQFIATDGPSVTTRTRIGGGSSASMLPGAQTPHDKSHSHGAGKSHGSAKSEQHPEKTPKFFDPSTTTMAS